jgi:1-acyl-sn-glycerol-3-phosphate acyltransferase
MKNSLKNWLATILFAPYFFGLLVCFHPLHLIAPLLGAGAAEKVLLWMNYTFLWGLKNLAGLKVSVEISEEYQREQPTIFVSNHQSMYDITLIVALLETGATKFVAKRELSKWLPSVSIALRNMQAALIDRKNRKQALEAITEMGKIANSTDRNVCIFPEGTRSRSGKLGRFKSSGLRALLKEMPQAQVCPVAISETWQILRYNFWPIAQGVQVTFKLGAPIDRTLPEDDLVGQLEQFIENNVMQTPDQRDKDRSVSKTKLPVVEIA